MDNQKIWDRFAAGQLAGIQAATGLPAWGAGSWHCLPRESSLRQALGESARLRALIAEYHSYGLLEPNGLAAEFVAAQARVKAAIAEDRLQRLLASPEPPKGFYDSFFKAAEKGHPKTTWDWLRRQAGLEGEGE